jgi:hypothetical protein
MSIILSQKFGVNPSMSQCYFCGEVKEIVLTGKLPQDKEAPREAVWNEEPCKNCAEYMKRGVILISVREGEEGRNPYRTGGWVVVTDDYIRRALQPPAVVEEVLKKRMCFVLDNTWKLLGLPKGDHHG